jgi:amino acid transporter
MQACSNARPLEETRDAARSAGLAAFWAMVIVILLFITFVAGALISLTDEEIQKSGTNVVFAVADKLLPRPWSYSIWPCSQ